MKLLIFLLLSFSLCNAQVPTDFKNIYDSITFVADPAQGTSAKQVVGLTRTLPGSIALPKGWFKIGIYTGKNAGPVEKFMQFSGFMTDSVDTSKNPAINISIIPSSYICIIPIANAVANKIPLLRIGATQYQFATSGSYYYLYLRRTTTTQTFRIDFDGSGDTNKMITVEPISGKVGVFSAATQTVSFNVTPAYK